MTTTPLEDFVRQYLERSPDPDDEIGLFLAWLEANGPDEWHRWAISWNWGHGVDLLEWIIDQPTCDRGTALSLYYAAQPDFYSTFASIEEIQANQIGDGSAFALILKICERWRNGGYATYAFRPSEQALTYLDQGPDAMRALAAIAPWDVPDDLAAAGIEGQPNEFERTIDGVPVEMLRAMGEDW